MCIIFFHRIVHGTSRYVMLINELYMYDHVQLAENYCTFHVFELFKNQFGKNKWLFELEEKFSGGVFKTVRGVRIIRVFELIGNLP